MKSFIQPGEIIDLAMPYDRLSGQGVLVGAIFGVCQGDALNTVVQAVKRTGLFTLAKLNTEVWATVGLPIYWDNTNKWCTTVNTGNYFIGYNTATAANPTATGSVVLANVSKAVG